MWRQRDGQWQESPDAVASEQPLAISIRQGREWTTWLTTLRTPGTDTALALGLLFAEGLIASRQDVVRLVEGCPTTGGLDANQVLVELAHDVSISPRPVMATASCGVCGRQSIEDLLDRPLPSVPTGPHLAAALLQDLPQRLLGSQAAYARTGGLHAAGWFSVAGELVRAAEDVGRHNAIDKVIGAGLLSDALPAGEAVLVVTGRLGFELVAKARVAGFPMVVAVGAPSSLAVELAAAAGMTVCGFVSDSRMNVYTSPERINDLPR